MTSFSHELYGCNLSAEDREVSILQEKEVSCLAYKALHILLKNVLASPAWHCIALICVTV